jgi:hypothetical protein
MKVGSYAKSDWPAPPRNLPCGVGQSFFHSFRSSNILEVRAVYVIRFWKIFYRSAAWIKNLTPNFERVSSCRMAGNFACALLTTGFRSVQILKAIGSHYDFLLLSTFPIGKPTVLHVDTFSEEGIDVRRVTERYGARILYICIYYCSRLLARAYLQKYILMKKMQSWLLQPQQLPQRT